MPRAFAPEMPSAHEDGCVTRADLVPHLDSSARALGKRFLLQRMDFLMLLPHRVRVVIEVDGRWQYSKEEGGQFHPSPPVCAETVRGDRDLRLTGYEVCRLSGYELHTERHAATVAEEFFARLFQSHGLHS